jgi:hypothetical protein
MTSYVENLRYMGLITTLLHSSNLIFRIEYNKISLVNVGNTDIGLKFEARNLSPLLYTGVTLAFFKILE